jgi:hypothetical protein
MSLRHIGLLAGGLLFGLGSIPALAGGEVVIGVMSALFAVMLVIVPVAELAPDGSGARLEDGALVVGISRVRRVLLVVGAVLFTAVSALLVATGSPFGLLAGALGVVTFGTFTVIGLWQLRGPTRLVMTADALRWDQGGQGKPVDWDDVTQVGMLTISGVPTLTIHVEPPRDGLLASMNRKLGGGDVNVPLNQTSVDNELLLSLVTVCAREPEARTTLATEATARRLQA